MGLWTYIDLWRDDIAGRDRAVLVGGEIVANSKWTTVAAHGYFIEVAFNDQNGNPRRGFFHVVENKQKGFVLKLPNDLKQGLRNGKIPSPIALYYDPEWPERNWLADANGELIDNYRDRLYYFGVCISVVQLVAVLLFALVLRSFLNSHQRLPWWYDVHKALPLMVLALLFGFVSVFVVGLGALFNRILR